MVNFFEIAFVYFVSLIILLIGSYLVCLFLPLLMFRKIDLRGSITDMTHEEPAVKIIIFSFIVFILGWYFVLRGFWLDADYSGIPILFYIIGYTFCWLEIATDESYGKDRPSFKYQMQGQIIAISLLMIYEIFINDTSLF